MCTISGNTKLIELTGRCDAATLATDNHFVADELSLPTDERRPAQHRDQVDCAVTGRASPEGGHGQRGRDEEVEALHELAQVRAQGAAPQVQALQFQHRDGLAQQGFAGEVGVGDSLLLGRQAVP